MDTLTHALSGALFARATAPEDARSLARRIAAGLAASAVLRRSRWPAVAASALLIAYVGFQYLQREKVVEFGERTARSLGLGGATVNVQPRPVSPFNWTVFVSDAEAHRFAHVNLNRLEPRSYRPGDGFVAMLDSVYEPLSAAHWETRTRYGEGATKALAREAWNSPAMAVYRWFADLPAFDGTSAGSTCVWFIDLRFYTPRRATQVEPALVPSKAGKSANQR